MLILIDHPEDVNAGHINILAWGPCDLLLWEVHSMLIMHLLCYISETMSEAIPKKNSIDILM